MSTKIHTANVTRVTLNAFPLKLRMSSGCHSSLLLAYVLPQILSSAVRQEKERSYKVEKKQTKLSPYADDTIFCVGNLKGSTLFE